MFMYKRFFIFFGISTVIQFIRVNFFFILCIERKRERERVKKTLMQKDQRDVFYFLFESLQCFDCITEIEVVFLLDYLQKTHIHESTYASAHFLYLAMYNSFSVIPMRISMQCNAIQSLHII